MMIMCHVHCSGSFRYIVGDISRYLLLMAMEAENWRHQRLNALSRIHSSLNQNWLHINLDVYDVQFVLFLFGTVTIISKVV